MSTDKTPRRDNPGGPSLRRIGLAAAAIGVALLAAGCGQSATSTSTSASTLVTPSLRPEYVSPDLTPCAGMLPDLRKACKDGAWDEAKQEQEANRAANATAEAQASAANAAATAPTNSRSSNGFRFGKGLNVMRLVIAAAVAITLAIVGVHMMPDAGTELAELPAGYLPTGPAAGRLRIAAWRKRLLGKSVIFAAVPICAFGIRPDLVIPGLVVAGIAWFLFYQRSEWLGHAERGLGLVHAEWAAAEAAAEAAAAEANANAVAPHDDLGLGLDTPRVQPVYPPEPSITLEQAHARGLGHSETNGFAPPLGGASAALLDAAGNINPARDALDQVARQLNWGMMAGSGDAAVWGPWVTLAGITYYPSGDCDVRLALHHASLDEGAIQRALPSLLRAWKCLSANVSRDTHTGEILLAVTNAKPVEVKPIVEEEWK